MKFYLIYQITNNVNGKIYIGKHKTNNLDDDYFGSGKHLNYAKEKYGLENFTKTILFYCANEKEMNLLEKCVVTSEFCQRDDVYNIMEGGSGGWNYVNLSSDYAIGSERRNKVFHSAGGKACQKKYKEEYGSFTSYVLQNMEPEKRKKLAEFHSNHLKCNWTGRKHKPESIQKMKDHNHHLQLFGEANGAYGKRWYKNPISFEYGIFSEDEVPEGWVPGKYHCITNNSNTASVKGKIRIRKTDLSEQKFVSKEEAEVLIASGEWEHKALPFSKEGLENIRTSAKNRSCAKLKDEILAIKNKLKFINIKTNEIKCFNLDDDIPDNFVLALGNIVCCIKKEDLSKIYIYKDNPIPDGYVRSCLTNDDFSKEQKHILALEKKRIYIEETQAMADYFTEYGYEATCKKFPGRSGTCSSEAMLMRFINARKHYGIKFVSIKNGRKRTFQELPEEEKKEEETT